MDDATRYLLELIPTVEIPEQANAVAEEALRMQRESGFGPNDLAIRCLHVHPVLWLNLVRNGVPAILTIGDVVVDGTPWFGVVEQGLANELKAPGQETLDLHAWLTLPEGGIFDATIRSTLTTKPRPRRVSNPNDLFTFVSARSTPVAKISGLSGASHTIEWVPYLVGAAYLDATHPRAQQLTPMINQALLKRIAMHRTP